MTCKHCGKKECNSGKDVYKSFHAVNAINDLLNSLGFSLPQRLITVYSLQRQIDISIEEKNKYNKGKKGLLIDPKLIKRCKKLVEAEIDKNNYREQYKKYLETGESNPTKKPSYVN